jgi:hypothetical protein
MARQKNREQKQLQPYDTSFKAWIRGQARDILPILVPGVTLEETLNVEIIRPTMRVDKVFRVNYRGEDHILPIEFESGADNDMPSQLLAYNTVLHYEYHLPVISMIMYPFNTKMAESPLRVKSGQEEIIVFHFLILPLFTMDAEFYVQEHLVCMYPLLPTMRGADNTIIGQAMDELAELYREDEVTLSQQFVWMNLLLERTETISPQEKYKIQERLHMYDPLWEEHPKVKKIQAESEIRALQSAVVTIVKARFPTLAELAQQKVAQINNSGALNLLLEQISTAPDEKVVRFLLSPSAA